MAKAKHHGHQTGAHNRSTPEDGFDRWKLGLDLDLKAHREDWDSYDKDIVVIVATYNANLASTPGYRPLDWRIIKAMIWVETGAANRRWATKPMQIGNPGDPGLSDLLNSKHGKLILPAEYQQALTMSNATANGRLNIEAGVGYLLKRFARFSMVPIVSSLPTENKTGTAPQSPTSTHRKSSAHSKKKPIRPPEKLAIVGWTEMSFGAIAQKYNVGDKFYERKLEYCWTILQEQPQ